MRYSQEEEASIASTIVSPSDLVIDTGADLPMEGFRRVTNATGKKNVGLLFSPQLLLPHVEIGGRTHDFPGPPTFGQAHSAHAH